MLIYTSHSILLLCNDCLSCLLWTEIEWVKFGSVWQVIFSTWLILNLLMKYSLIWMLPVVEFKKRFRFLGSQSKSNGLKSADYCLLHSVSNWQHCCLCNIVHNNLCPSLLACQWMVTRQMLNVLVIVYCKVRFSYCFHTISVLY